MGIRLTDVLLFGKADFDDVDNATFVIYRRNILRWGAIGSILDIIVKGVAPLSLPDAIADSLSYVKAFGGTEYVAENYIDSVTVDGKCEQRNLPDNYIQRDYIYMMDRSYLLTDIVPTSDCKIEMDFQTTSLPGGSEYFLGGRTVGYGGLFFARTIGGGFIVDAFGTGAANRYTSNIFPTNNTRYKFTYDNQVAKVESGGTTLFTNTFSTTNANGAALCINGLNSLGEITPGQSGIYLYSFKAWNAQGELVADYVPAIQKGTVPVVGFYDTVSGTFKTATAGTFAAGSETMPTPDAPMDIWCNNGVLKATANLFNPDNTQEDHYLWTSMTTTANRPAQDYYGSNVIPVKGNTKYTRNGTHGGINYFLLSDNTSTSTTDSNDTITTPANAVAWVFNVGMDSARNTMMVVEGETLPDEYVPYGVYSDGTAEVLTDDVGNTASVANVLSCSNVKDTHEVVSGTITHKVGVVILDGTETGWTYDSTYTRFRLQTLTNNYTTAGTRLTPFYCSHYQVISDGRAIDSVPDNSFYSGGNNEIKAIYIKTSAFSDVNLFKQYLTQQRANGTPVMVVYQLATATTESVAGQVLTKTPVTQTAGSLTTNITTVATDHTVPTPTQPLDINCNNGVLKARHQSGLPLAYTELEYVNMSTGSYLLTDIVPASNMRIEMDFATTSISSLGNAYFGCRTKVGGVEGIGLLHTASASGGYIVTDGFVDEGRYVSNYAPVANTRYKYVYNAGEMSLSTGGTIVVSNTFTPDSTVTTPIAINGFNDNGSVSTNREGTYLYSFKVWDNQGNLIADYVPAKNSSGVVGLYDLVSGQFFTNAGTGDFTAGSTVSDPVEIYADGTVETIGMRGGNLVDNTIPNANINMSGEIVSSSTVFITHTAPVTPGETYTCNNVATLAYYTSKPDVGSVSYNNNRVVTTNPTFTVPNDPTIKYVALRNATADSWVIKGSTKYNGGTATAEMLLKVGNYEDVQSIIDGVVTRKVGIKVLDGTENWVGAGQGAASGYLVAIRKSEFAPDINTNAGYNSFLCSHLKMGNNDAANTLSITDALYGVRLGLNTDITAGAKITNAKKWLADQYNAGTPVIIVYPLATATTESVTGQTLQVQDGDNVLEITQASMNNLELEVEYQAAVSLTIQEVQDANLDPNVEVTIN